MVEEERDEEFEELPRSSVGASRSRGRTNEQRVPSRKIVYVVQVLLRRKSTSTYSMYGLTSTSIDDD